MDTKRGRRLIWLEISKAIALVLIIFNHALERMGDYPYIFNPADDWVPFADRVDQLKPLTDGVWEIAFNAFRYTGLFGEVGVQLFVIASGIGLTLSAMRRRGTDAGFFRRRLERIAPTWIVVHFLALLASIPVLLFVGGGAVDRVAAPWDIRFWASLIGFRFTPETIYYLVPSWWFIALLIQLYLVFPLLYRWFERMKPRGFWYLIAGSIVIKLAGLYLLSSYLDVWARGAFFITRLPEFAFGMIVARWLTSSDNPLRRPAAVPAAVVAIPVGIVSSLYLAGNAWGPFLYGAGVFVLLYRLFADRPLDGRVAGWTTWVGKHSLSLFILHQPVYFVLMPGYLAGPARVIGAFIIASVLTIIGGVVLEFISDRVSRLWRDWSQRGVFWRRVVIAGVGALVIYGGIVGVDLWVRSNDPQEVLGWGERPSLIADEALGWKLAPNQTTRLQWQSYDYTVTANEFGFPGPAADPAPQDLKVLALGDAFTSAEGVDTDRAWPRLLEEDLGDVTVWNGAITGFGPPQYATVAEQLVPLLDPDAVVVGFFVNDFYDSEFDYESMQESIGFGRPDPTGIVPSLQWANVSKYLRYNVTEPLLSLAGIPNRTGFLLGQFESFDPGAIDDQSDAYQLTLAAMEQLARVAPDARRVLLLIPSAIQVCAPEDLGYFPDNVALTDFDLDQPQRLAIEIAEATGMETLDLRPVLSAAAECPYQPENMHWLERGHQLVADAVAELLRR